MPSPSTKWTLRLSVFDGAGRASEQAIIVRAGGLPTITGVTAQAACPGDVIEIRGFAFGVAYDNSMLLFGQHEASDVIWWSATCIVARLPLEASGVIAVRAITAQGASNAVMLEVIPSITAISPASAGPGSQVEVLGFGFGQERLNSRVLFDDVEAAGYTFWSNTLIRVTVPDGESGAICVCVETQGGRSAGAAFERIAGTLLALYQPEFVDYSDTVTVRARLLTAEGLPLANRAIILSLAGAIYTSLTDSEGLAVFAIEISLPSGEYQIDATFQGDATWQGSADSSVMWVSPLCQHQ
jgi:hypothetical protein